MTRLGQWMMASDVKNSRKDFERRWNSPATPQGISGWTIAWRIFSGVMELIQFLLIFGGILLVLWMLAAGWNAILTGGY